MLQAQRCLYAAGPAPPSSRVCASELGVCQRPASSRIHSANIDSSSSLGQQAQSDAGFLGVSTHPDAVRRREQAQAKRAAAAVDAELARKASWWEDAGLPGNLKSPTTPEEFQELLARESLVVVKYFAPWCAACRRLYPQIMKLAQNNSDVLFLKVNGGDETLSKFVESLGVDRLPYFHFYRNGQLQAHFAANLTKINLLRAEIAAHKECRAPSCIL